MKMSILDRYTAEVARLASIIEMMEDSIEQASGFAARLRAADKTSAGHRRDADALKRVLVLWKAERDDKPLCGHCKGDERCVACGGSGNVARGSSAEITCDVCDGDRSCVHCVKVVAALWDDGV